MPGRRLGACSRSRTRASSCHLRTSTFCSSVSPGCGGRRHLDAADQRPKTSAALRRGGACASRASTGRSARRPADRSAPIPRRGLRFARAAWPRLGRFTHCRGTRKPTPDLAISPLYFVVMSDRVHSDFHACPVCDGRGTIPSRLPARTRPCDACGGHGIVPPLKRVQLLAKLKAKAWDWWEPMAAQRAKSPSVYLRGPGFGFKYP